MELNKIYNQDCLAGMKELPDGSVDLVVTDPPYKITARGNASESGGLFLKERTLKGFVFEHNDVEIDDYIDEFYRVLKDDAHCYIMTNNVNICYFLDVISNSKFHFVKCLIWNKLNKVCGTYYMNQYEYIIFIRKGKDKQINDCGCSDIISVPNKKTKDADGRNIHDSEKPVELMKILITNSTQKGEVVLDPFMGSGSTAIAALDSERNFIGFEIDSAYCEIANKRIDKYLNNAKQVLF